MHVPSVPVTYSMEDWEAIERGFTPEPITVVQNTLICQPSVPQTLLIPEDPYLALKGITVKIKSKTLNEEVCICHPEDLELVQELYTDLVCYGADEIIALKGATLEEIKAAHYLKAEFREYLLRVELQK